MRPVHLAQSIRLRTAKNSVASTVLFFTFCAFNHNHFRFLSSPLVSGNESKYTIFFKKSNSFFFEKIFFLLFRHFIATTAENSVFANSHNFTHTNQLKQFFRNVFQENATFEARAIQLFMLTTTCTQAA